MLDELAKRVDTLALALESVRTSATVEIAHIKDGLKDVQALLKELQSMVGKGSERLASLE